MCTVNRRASSFARSRTSSDEPREPLRLGGDRSRARSRAPPRSSTSPSLSAATWPRIAVSGVRSSCDTDIRKLRSSCSASLSRQRHLAEAVGEMADLGAARDVGHLDVVVAERDLVRDARELEHRAREPPREVRREEERDDQAAEQRQPEPREQRHDARLRAGPSASRRRARRRSSRRRVQRLRDREPRLASSPADLNSNCSVCPRSTGLKSLRRRTWAGAGAAPACSREELEARDARHVVDAVAGRELELRRRHRIVRAARLPPRRAASAPCPRAAGRPARGSACTTGAAGRRSPRRRAPETMTPARKSAGSWKRRERNTARAPGYALGLAPARATPCSRRPRR